MLLYDRAWTALNQMLRAGRAFSGNERSCAFLNTRGGRFASLSATWNLDFADDGRGMASCDWDFDGDLDIWTTNRTGPPVRLMRNDHPGRQGHLSLLLQGVRVNRDAIGGRVEVYLRDEATPLLRTRHAGDGFLSQSSKWLHFGLGDANGIDKIVVRWPGGEAETFAGTNANGRYLLVEGSGRAKQWQSPTIRATELAEAPFVPQKSTEVARAVLLRPALLPPIEYVDAEGARRAVVPRDGRSLLVNLWAPWCKPCLTELAAWRRSQAELDAARIDVLAICVDEPSNNPAADAAKHAKSAEVLKLPFAIGVPADDLIDMLEVFQLTYYVRQSPLPIPSSFLIDPDGMVSAIYKGPIEPEQLVRDAWLYGAGTGERVAASIPSYGGRWIDEPKGMGLFAVASKLLSSGDLESTNRYVRHILAYVEPKLTMVDQDSQEWRDLKSDAIKCYDLLGRMAFDAGKMHEAIARFEQVLNADPQARAVRGEIVRAHLALNQLEQATRHVEALLDARRDDPDNLLTLAGIRLQMKQPAEAIALFEEALNVRDDVQTRYRFAAVYLSQSMLAKAVEQYRAALKIQPSFPPAANDLAWVLATHPADRVRNGKEAVALARAACQATGEKIPNYLNTLAVALAENGEFDEAIDVGRRALVLTSTGGNDKNGELAELIRTRLELFEQRKPFRDESLSKLQ